MWKWMQIDCINDTRVFNKFAKLEYQRKDQRFKLKTQKLSNILFIVEFLEIWYYCGYELIKKAYQPIIKISSFKIYKWENSLHFSNQL
jgi:hypothetical protein